MCRDKEHATDMGADCIAITRDAKNPQAAADFLQFMANKENLAYYDVNAGALPTRTSLQQPGALSYPTFTDSYASTWSNRSIRDLTSSRRSLCQGSPG